MRRIHLFELHDLEWFPNNIREYITDFLSFFAYHVNPYKPAIKKLCEALIKSHCSKILDLCSGKGQYMLKLLNCMKSINYQVDDITLTDKYPSIEAFKFIRSASDNHISFSEDSIDAVNVKNNIDGFRTFFSSFHHFKPEQAQKIISDAVEAKQGIGIFEYSNRNLIISILAGLFGPLLVIMLTPLVTPFSWKRLFWTYIIPVVPIAFGWDGFISHLRTYTVDELKSFAQNADSDNYHWEIATVRSLFGFCIITYLIGYCLTKSKNN